ncbi:MAG: hypothetical protein IKG80_04145 [Clostridia bacterium]|nr:hypothetical protein [Exiguobacterium sp.]MBR3320710.1 hypothetical protein [Exiguobacterium sp.]MBR3423661.1 hypothetical protein [Clostridia bacterium]
MKYGRLIENGIRLLNLPIRDDDEDVFTNDPTILAQYGYKPIVYDTQPELNENEYSVAEYTEEADAIRVSWKVEESDEATIEDYEAALEELGVNTGSEEPEE